MPYHEDQSERLKDKLYIIIFRETTRAGKWFNVSLLAAIILSVVVVLMDSVPAIHTQHGKLLYFLEWAFTVLFTVEYILRIYCLEDKPKYIFSLMGIIDLLAILPTYLSVFVFGYQALLVVRSLRLLRIFRMGYGDISPGIPLGKFLSVMVMLCGYSIIAVPTGIITAEMARARLDSDGTGKHCGRCGAGVTAWMPVIAGSVRSH